MITKQYFITCCFDDDDRPNVEILYSSRNLDSVKKVLQLVKDYQSFKNNDDEISGEEIREDLEDNYGVNTYDLDYADVDSRIYQGIEVSK